MPVMTLNMKWPFITVALTLGAAILVLSNVPDIPTHRMIGPDDQVPQWMERSAILLPCTHGVHCWDLHKTMVLQMDCLIGVKVYKIEWTE